MVFKSILIIAFAFAFTNAEKLFDACYKDDLKCLEAATETFLSKTFNGFADYGLKPIDPLIVPSVEFTADKDMGMVFYFKDVNVTGLKNLKISDFKMDTTTKSVVLKTKADVNIVSDFKVGLTKADKTFEGPYTASATIFGTMQYGYNLKDIKGVQYFEVGPETNTCEIEDEPTVTLGSDLVKTLSSDQNAISLKGDWEPKKSAIRKKAICEIMKTGLATIMHNLREIARAFPKEAFFKDI